MATVALYEGGFLKRGEGIRWANFHQIWWDNNKREQKVQLMIDPESRPPVYRGIFLAIGANGTVEVSADGFKSKRFNMSNGGAYEILLSR